MRRQRAWLAFTLVELLVVIAVMLVLAGLFLPVLSRVKESGRAAHCVSNLRQLAAAFLAYESDYKQMPWLDSGVWVPYTRPDGTQGLTPKDRCWHETLRYLKYLPNDVTSGVWRCRSVRDQELREPDVWGYPSRWGGYGVCANIFRYEMNQQEVRNKPLRTIHIPRPAETWLIGDVGQPAPGSEPGEGRYFRPGSSFGRPSKVGGWSFAGAFPPNQPALRHRQRGNWAAFDGHVSSMSWNEMAIEKGNFTARGEKF